MKRRKEIRMEQIAAEVGVSTVTVSNALRGRKGVSEELRKRICETAEAMGYQLSEDVVKEERSFTIGIAVAERYIKIFPSFYMEVYKCVAHELTKRRCMVVFEVINAEQEKMIHGFSMFYGAEIEGIILIGETDQDYIREMVKKYASIPLVCIDYYDMFENIDYVVTNSYGGMQQMTELLLDAGHRDLVFVGTPEATGSIMDRYLGFCRAMEKREVKLRENHILHDREADGYDYNLDVELPETLPDAFVCNCDKCANILIEKLLQKGIQVPEDVSVVSFDHHGLQGRSGLELTTYENDERVLAHVGVGIMLKRLNGNEKAVGIHIVEGKVICGNTVRTVKKIFQSNQSGHMTK